MSKRARPRTGIGMTSQRTRDRLITRLRDMGIEDERVLTAIRTVPRHLFVEEALASRAYEDRALPIGYGQTISQPYIVALMTQALLAGRKPAAVLEVGSGSGYQTAVLAALVDKIYSVERIEPLLQAARRRLIRLGYRNVHCKLADGSWGWREHAPYDGIMVTAAAVEVPHPLIEQLALDGHMVVPVGEGDAQELLLITRTKNGVSKTRLEHVSFVPLVKGQG
ncbi:MAG: protein-L-isoaspartate(D-aspartate) O-methyltransferase [Acidiferrobacterales bacterium]